MKQIITLEQLIQIKGQPPICRCDKCKITQTKVNIHPDKDGSYIKYLESDYPQYIQYHSRRSTEFKKGRISHNKIVIGDFSFIPYKCKCGCNNVVPLNKKRIVDYEREGYPIYIHGHNRKGTTHITSEETRKLSSEKLKGKKAWNKNISCSEKHKQNLSISHRGQHSSPSTEFKKGQVSQKLHLFSDLDHLLKDKYCPKFNNHFKESIRIRDSHTCQLCGISQEKYKFKTGNRLTVHHIHYLKLDCEPDCITLCCSCNFKANTNRSYWEQLFMNKLNDRNLLFWTKYRNK